jgi:hypothetical protein
LKKSVTQSEEGGLSGRVKASGIQWLTVEGPPWHEKERKRRRNGHGTTVRGRGGAPLAQ